jgi:hypothetical protein
MMGKMGLFGALAIISAVLLVLVAVPRSGYSANYQTGGTTMNVTVRGYVSVTASSCLTYGITFSTQDPNTNDNNASCNTGGPSSGSGLNLTVDPSSTVSINFTHATNRTNLTDGINTLNIGNVTSNSNSTANSGTNLLDAGTSTGLSMTWMEMETCGTLGTSSNCWSAYFLDVPAAQAPGVYKIGYCWCGRQQGTAEANCGTCT